MLNLAGGDHRRGEARGVPPARDDVGGGGLRADAKTEKAQPQIYKTTIAKRVQERRPPWGLNSRPKTTAPVLPSPKATQLTAQKPPHPSRPTPVNFSEMHTSDAERHVASPPHDALLAVAVSADAKTEKAEEAHSNGREATVACSSRTRPPTEASTLRGKGWGEQCAAVPRRARV